MTDMLNPVRLLVKSRYFANYELVPSFRVADNRKQSSQLSRSPQQLVNDGFDVNDGCIEKLDTRNAGFAQ